MIDLMLTAAPAKLPAWWRVSTESLYFVALATVIGGSLAYRTVVAPTIRASAAELVSLGHRAQRLLGWLGPVLLVAAYLQLAARIPRADPGTSFAEALTPGRIWRFLLIAQPGRWTSDGTLLMVQNALFAVVVTLLMTLLLPTKFGPADAARRDRTVLLAGTLAAVGNMVYALPTGPKPLDTLVDDTLTQVHDLAACSWLGGLAGLAALALSARHHATHPLGEHASLFWARIWQRFSVVALCAVGALLTSGCWLVWKHVGGPGELISTVYGRFLLVKLLMVATMVISGGYNQFRLTPRIARAHAAGDVVPTGFMLTMRRFPAVVAAETTLGLGVLLIVPFPLRVGAGPARRRPGPVVRRHHPGARRATGGVPGRVALHRAPGVHLTGATRGKRRRLRPIAPNTYPRSRCPALPLSTVFDLPAPA